MLKIDFGTDTVTPSVFDARPWTALPPATEWRTCKCHAFVTVRYVQSDGQERFQEVCPACLGLNPDAKTNWGRDNAAAHYGSWRVGNAVDRASFKAMSEWERVGLARRWIWQARYVEHMKSPEWSKIRQEVLGQTGGYCERCNNRAAHVHHKTYDRLGSERIEDLEALCRECHWEEHGRVF